MPESTEMATELMILRVAKALLEIDCHQDYRGMVMKNVGTKWSLDPDFANFLARAAVRSIGTVSNGDQGSAA